MIVCFKNSFREGETTFFEKKNQVAWRKLEPQELNN